MRFSVDDYKKAVDHYRAKWDALDEALYRLCRDHPDNTDRGSVYAKLWIIGRTYATGIERKVATKHSQGSSMSQIADYLLAHGRRINELVAELRSVTEPLTPIGIRTIVSVHGRFVGLLTSITRKRQSPRSFVSKYLHFHNPAVPIFDSIAAGVLPKLVRWTKSLEIFAMPSDADKPYVRHVMRLYGLYQIIAKEHVRLTVKYMDYYLLWLADGRES